MKKNLIISLIFVAVNLFAQDNQDVIYLKNGGILKGQIIESSPTGDIKIKAPNNTIFSYKATEIEKIERIEGVEKKQEENNIGSIDYWKAEDVVFAGTIGMKIIITKSNNCKNCDEKTMDKIRKYINQIQNQVIKRLTPSTLQEYNNLPNKSVFLININNIDYEFVKGEKYNGYYCTIKYYIKEYTKTDKFVTNNTKNYSARSTLKVNSGKDVALEGALQDFDPILIKQFSRGFPYPFTAIELEKDKKNRPKYLVIFKPPSFRSQYALIIVEDKKDLKIIDNDKIQISKRFAVLSCTTPRGDEQVLKCKIKKKFRESFKKYDGKLDQLGIIGF